MIDAKTMQWLRITRGRLELSESLFFTEYELI
jgi:hypothetical protein